MRINSEICSEFEVLCSARCTRFILILLIHLDPAFDKFSFLLRDNQALLIYLNRLYVLYIRILLLP